MVHREEVESSLSPWRGGMLPITLPMLGYINVTIGNTSVTMVRDRRFELRFQPPQGCVLSNYTIRPENTVYTYKYKSSI